MIKKFACVLWLATMALPALAQTLDEQLLAAQMAYQQANNLQEQAQARLTQAQAAKQQADQRLADAQMAAQRAAEELSAATAANTAASEQLQQHTRQLQEAWQRKEAGG
ncbi:hypothetical protein [Aquitalea sp. ASV15]|uniref:hypothetical protein n=1 Tax=Aquitalea sp. ASV15 TaxID=2795104 RepID=UPI0018EC7AA7|nr:hypothetical protein [Aquitalea sp. ASV15]